MKYYHLHPTFKKHLKKYRKAFIKYQLYPNHYLRRSLKRKLKMLKRRIIYWHQAIKMGVTLGSLFALLHVPVQAQLFPAILKPTSLNGENGFVISNRNENLKIGDHVGSAGDVNGDGITDFIVGGGGQQFVIFGRTSGFKANIDINSIDGTNGFTILSFANAINSGGDVNGDGLDDLILANNFDIPDSRGRTGRVYVIFGKNGSFPTTISFNDLDGSNGFVLNGIDNEDRAGSSLNIAGDINNDGIDDIVIGAKYADPEGISEAGEAYVVFGTDQGFGSTFELSGLDGNNGFVIKGIGDRNLLGRAVSSGGDINGDGIDDLVVGASGVDRGSVINAGATYAIFGSSTPFPPSIEVSSLNGTNGFEMKGLGGSSSRLVEIIGDVNGGGLSDVIISAVNTNGGAGEGYVVFGNSAGYSGFLDIKNLNGSNGFFIPGLKGGDNLSGSLGVAGDVNGDGLADIILGAANADPDEKSSAGECYVILGSNSPQETRFDLSALDGINGFTFKGEITYNQVGSKVSGAGDINGDGVDDIIIGANSSDPNISSRTGECYVVFGVQSDEPPSVTLSPAADAMVNNAVPKADENFGTNNKMYARNKPNGWAYKAYLQFSLEGLSLDKVNQAKLRLFGENQFNNREIKVAVFETASDWQELEITYNNAPGKIGSELDEVVIDGTSQYYEWNVTSFVKTLFNQQAKKVSFLLISTNQDDNYDYARFNTKEATQNPPLLFLSTESDEPVDCIAREFIPSADAYINNKSYLSDNNFGTKKTLVARNKPNGWGYESYLQFDIESQGTPDRVILRLFGQNPDNDRTVHVGIFPTLDSWEETQLSFNNAPGPQGDLIASANISNQERYYEFDVTEGILSEVNKNGKASFLLQSLETDKDYDRAVFHSKESLGFPPQLLFFCNEQSTTKMPYHLEKVGVSADRVSKASSILKVFPNPAISDLHFALSADTKGPVSVGLWDMAGRKVRQQIYQKHEFDVIDRFHVEALPSGIYLLSIQLPNEIINKRVMIH